MHPYLASLIGGVIIGLSASALLGLNGRIAGVSGIAAGLFFPARDDTSWRGAFLVGLVAGGVFLRWLAPAALGSPVLHSPVTTLAAGLMVGVGTQLGSGCTSGHGVCGLAAGSSRSLAAVMTFMATGAVTVYLLGHVLQVAP